MKFVTQDGCCTITLITEETRGAEGPTTIRIDRCLFHEAAPDLLAALEEVLRAYNGEEPYGLDDLEVAMAQVRDVIQRAKEVSA